MDLNLLTLSVGNEVTLPLDAYNRSLAQNRRIGPWFCLVMALICVAIGWLGYCHRHSTELIIEILKKRKKTGST